MLRVTNQPAWVSVEAERFLHQTWLKDWEWTGQSFTPYDFRKARDDGYLYADCKSAKYDDHLQVSTKWIEERIEKYDLAEMAVIAVFWDQFARSGRDFRALGWATVSRLASSGEKRDRPKTRFSRGGRFTFMHIRDLQPMRVLPC